MAIKVKATKLGYYNHKRQKPEAVFIIRSDKEFSEQWMTKLETVDDSFAPKDEPKMEVTEENKDLAAISKGSKSKGWKKLEADKDSSVI